MSVEASENVKKKVESPEVKALRLKKFRLRLFRSLCGLGIIILLGFGVSPWLKIGFNGTDSVDGFMFLIVKNAPIEKNELSAFWPPDNDFTKNIWFVKYVKGVPGDVVSRDGQNFYINNVFVGAAKEKSYSGVNLKAGITGTIPEGYYFVWTPNPDSFDSRYDQINWIPKSSFIGRAYRIF